MVLILFSANTNMPQKQLPVAAGGRGQRGAYAPGRRGGGRLQGVGGNFFRSDMHLIAVNVL